MGKQMRSRDGNTFEVGHECARSRSGCYRRFSFACSRENVVSLNSYIINPRLTAKSLNDCRDISN